MHFNAPLTPNVMQRDPTRRDVTPASFLVRRKLEVLRGDNEKVPEIVLNDTARPAVARHAATPLTTPFTPPCPVSRGISRVYRAHFRHAKSQSGLSSLFFFSFYAYTAERDRTKKLISDVSMRKENISKKKYTRYN